jgi:transcription elongation factor GreA
LDTLKTRLASLRQQRLQLREDLRQVRDQQAASNAAEDEYWVNYMRKLDYVEAEMDRIQHILSRAKVVVHDDANGEVRLGSKVSLQGDTQGVSYHFTIVNSLEANPIEGKISDESPFGRQLLGKKVSEIITLNLDRLKKLPTTLRIVNIE